MSCVLRSNVYYFTLHSVIDGKAQYARRPFASNKTFDNIFFSEKQRLKRKLDIFVNKQEVYTKFGVPRTLGFLFSGLPGCGKTACAKCIANYTKRHVIVIPLHKVTNMTVLTSLFFNEEIDSVRVPFDSRIYVFEEIDCNGWDEIVSARTDESRESRDTSSNVIVLSSSESSYRREKSEEECLGKVTLGGLLELLDGIAETPGRLIIVTTNHPEKLDPALIRPGRIDMHVSFGLPTANDVISIVRHFFGNDVVLSEDDVDSIVNAGMTHAELCQCFMEYQDDFESALCIVTSKK